MQVPDSNHRARNGASREQAGAPSVRGNAVPAFRKRIYAWRQFARDLGFIAANAPEYVAVVRGRRVSLALAEKLRLVASGINQCVLCARLHREWAAWSGVDAAEIRDLLQTDLHGGTVLDSELTALLYAQEYAEHGGSVARASKQLLIDRYGAPVAHDIELILRLINFFNLTLNTTEAFLSRVSGHGVASDSNLGFELFVALLSAPIAAPLLAYTHFTGNRVTFGGASSEANAKASTAPDARIGR